ncbi:hypothetical protein QEJ31_02615 [Pigmentibacter sp. JX0631]|uniref:hypothetical protein n=1 Tax=Pigmentibacter sp. JX0631 TaxID=2976982 RepID=UPI0024696FB9|nr:hypothetical protein [Pigmentibacter sp. JX0631]WGL60494.1 hypothetical protein QEJ31_02615 [Pigmentibacter sp. JX0631]
MPNYLKIKNLEKSELKINSLSKNNQFNQDKFMNWIESPSYSFVILFFKFIKEDFYQTGDLSFFKTYFEDNCKEFQNYLVNLQEINCTVVKNSYISTDLMRPAKEMQQKLIQMTNKMSELEKQGCEISNTMRDEISYEQRRFQKFNEDTLGKFTPDLKSLLSSYDTLGQSNDLTNLDAILKNRNGSELLDTFFSSDDESELEGVDRASAYLLRCTHALYGSIQDQNITIQTSYCHFQKEFTFYNELEKDIRQYSIDKKGCYFYFLNEVNNSKLNYGLFVYHKFKKMQLCFYHPNQGITELSGSELPKLKNILEKIFKKNGDNYCSFRIFLPIKDKNITIGNEELLSSTLFTVIKQSAYSYKEYIQTLKTFFLSSEQKAIITFCNESLTYSADAEGITNTVTAFFSKFSEFIFKIKSNNLQIQNKSFFVFFLINYLTRFNNLANKQLNTLEIGLGTDKLSDYVLDFFNSKNERKDSLSQKTITTIFLEVYNNVCKVNHRIPFSKYFKNKELSEKQSNIIDKLFESFDLDIKTTLTDWNRQAIIYNERYLSGRIDGKYTPNYSIECIGKTPTPSTKVPNIQELQTHFAKATQCQDVKFLDFCLGVCNQTHFFGLGHLLVAHFNINHNVLIGLSKKYIYIQKIGKNKYDFMILFYIDQYEKIGVETNNLKKLKDPIYFSYVFMLDTEAPQLVAKNIRVGFLNKTKETPINTVIQNQIMEALQDEMLNQFYTNKKTNLLQLSNY